MALEKVKAKLYKGSMVRKRVTAGPRCRLKSEGGVKCSTGWITLELEKPIPGPVTLE